MFEPPFIGEDRRIGSSVSSLAVQVIRIKLRLQETLSVEHIRSLQIPMCFAYIFRVKINNKFILTSCFSHIYGHFANYILQTSFVYNWKGQRSYPQSAAWHSSSRPEEMQQNLITESPQREYFLCCFNFVYPFSSYCFQFPWN